MRATSYLGRHFLADASEPVLLHPLCWHNIKLLEKPIMDRYLPRSYACLGLMFFLSVFSESACADFVTYTDRSSFEAMSIGLSTIDFEGIVDPGSFAYFGDPGSLAIGGVNFQTNGALFVQNNNLYGTGAFLSPQQPPANSLDITDITLPAGVTALGFNFSAGYPITLSLSGGESITLPGDFPNLDFIGITTDTPITSIELSVQGGVDLDNFSFGQAVPEPSSVLMLGLGSLGLIGVVKRSSRKTRSAGI